MDWNVILPLASAVLSLIFALMLLDQWRTRKRAYQLVWAFGMLWYGISAGTEWFGGAFGWSEPLYRTWYLIGAVWVAAWLGLGTVYLLARTRFGYSLAFSFVLASLFTYLSWQRYQYADSGVAIVLYPVIGLALAAVIVVLTYRGDQRWASLTGAALVVGTLASAVLVLTVPLPPPGYYVDPATGSRPASCSPATSACSPRSSTSRAGSRSSWVRSTPRTSSCPSGESSTTTFGPTPGPARSCETC